MDKSEILQIFRSSEALLDGHFVLTSGKHSAAYFQCAKVLQYPKYLTQFSRVIVNYFENDNIDTVISPAIGGIVVGTEVGRQLGVKTIFTERAKDKMKLRRGFNINKGEKILIVEDVLTTGGSINEVINIVQENDGIIVGIGVIVDRSGGKIKLSNKQISVIKHETVSYSNAEIPKYLAKIPIKKPGSREIK